MRRPLVLPLCAVALIPAALVASGCGDATKTVSGTNASGQTTTRTVPDVKFAKTKFVLHTGLALGAFHRYIYKPWKAGKLKKGADGRVAALAKAAAAGAFTAHELGSARDAALSDDRLRGLGDRLTALTDNVKGLVPGLGNGNASSLAQIAKLSAGLGSISALASAAGVNVKELNVPNLPTG
jgi:hypothetical protein